MPKEWGGIAMNPDELREFLRADNRLILATLDDANEPWGDAVAYTLQENRIYFRIPAGTRSLKNIRRDNRVACVVESHPKGTEYYAIKGATAHGSATEGSTSSIDAMLQGIPDPVAPSSPSEGVVFSVDLEDIVSFAFERIKYRYEDQRPS